MWLNRGIYVGARGSVPPQPTEQKMKDEEARALIEKLRAEVSPKNYILIRRANQVIGKNEHLYFCRFFMTHWARIKAALPCDSWILRFLKILQIQKEKRARLGKYRKLYKGWGPGKRAANAWIAEKGSYLFFISDLERRIETAKESTTPPTRRDLERVRRLKKFSDISLLLSITLAIIFFVIETAPLRCICKIGLIILIIGIICFLNRRLFSFLQEIK